MKDSGICLRRYWSHDVCDAVAARDDRWRLPRVVSCSSLNRNLGNHGLLRDYRDGQADQKMSAAGWRGGYWRGSIAGHGMLTA